MRAFILTPLIAFFAAMPAMAQTTAAPVAPSAVSAVPLATSASPSPQTDIAAQLQKFGGSKNSQAQMGQMVLVGSILGCTQKSVGKPATDAFYRQMQAVGKQAGAYCKQGSASDARALVLGTLAAKKDDPVVKAALSCYDAQGTMITSLAGPQMAQDAAHYARWLRDPELAKSEMKESDICR